MAKKGDYAKMTPEQKQKQFKQVNESRKKTMTQLSIRFHNENDSDVIAYLDAVPNKADFIRKLVRQYATEHPLPGKS